MRIHLLLFISYGKERQGKAAGSGMMKTFESDIRPVAGDILDDPGFHPKFHNGYEVAKVTLNYAENACWVSLTPLAIELEEIDAEEYAGHLKAHGWREVTKEEWQLV